MTGSGCPNAEPARWWANTAPPNGSTRRCPPTRRHGSASFCGTSPSVDPGGDWRRAAAAARRAGWQVNNKRIRRLWRDEGLRVPQKRRKKRLIGIGAHVGAMCPIRPDALWALDFQFDTTTDGRTVKMLNVIDEFTPRECLAIEVARSIDADGVVAVLDRLAIARGRAPAFVPLRQRARVHRSRRGGLVPLQPHRFGVHRPRLSMAERLDRVLQRPVPRRVPQRSATSTASSKPAS